MEHKNWNGFIAGRWQDEINVRDFIQQNYKEYTGDAAFLAEATPRTKALMKKLEALFALERQFGGVLDIDQGGEGSHLFRLTCSVVLWGGRNIANKYHWCVWGVLAVYGPQWVCPSSLALSQCAFLVYTAQASGCSAGELSKVGPAFRALPRSKPLVFSDTLQGHRLCWACVLCPSQVREAQATRCLASALSQVGHAS